MGRRAKKAPVQTKKRPTLAKQFKCPFCANENVVECKMDFKKLVGTLACRLCGASYQMPIHHLHEPVDVFSEWLDDCEAAAQGRQSSHHNTTVTMGSGGGAQSEQGNSNDQRRGDESDSEAEEEALREATSSKHKLSSSPSGISKAPGKKQKTNKDSIDDAEKESTRPSYTELGLDDSDEDSDED